MIKQQNSTWSTKKIMAHLSKSWNKMSSEEKKVYVNHSNEDKRRFKGEKIALKQ